jgi:hypothetical protein
VGNGHAVFTVTYAIGAVGLVKMPLAFVVNALMAQLRVVASILTEISIQKIHLQKQYTLTTGNLPKRDNPF